MTIGTFLKRRAKDVAALLFGAVLGTAVLAWAAPGTLVTIIDSAGNAVGTTTGSLNVNCTGGCAGSGSTSTAINDGTVTSQKAGVGANGALSIQGVVGGTAVPITGSISATNPSVGTTGTTTPTSATLVGVSDGTNLQPARGDTTNGLWANVKASVLPTNAAQETGGNLATVAGWNAAGQNATAPSAEAVIGCIFAASPASITTGNAGFTHCDSLGYLITDFSKINSSSVLAGAGATGTGSQRVTAAQDTTTIAGSAPGTAGTPSANVVSVQGVASGTTIPVTPAANSSVNVNQIGGSAISTAATGTQKVGITGNTGAAVDAAGQNAASPANELLTGCQFNTSPSTITTANMSPVQCDNVGDTLVKVNAALPAGGNAIGAVTQASGPWTNNVTQFGGTNVATGTGASGAGIPRVTISNDSSLAANQSVNVAQVNGVTTLTGAGATGTGSQRTTVAQDTTTIAGSAVGTAGSPSTNVVSVQGESSMTPLLVTPSAPADPCFASLKLQADFESASSGGSIITAVSAKKAYICSVTIVASAAANVSLIEGTGSSVCTGGTTAGDFLNTGVTAANGAAFAANGGATFGSGNGTVFFNNTANQNTCVVFTTTNSPQVNVHVTYVQQ